MGDPDRALLCFVKSIMASQTLAPACISEINEIQDETGMPLPLSSDVDMLLEQASIPCAPSEALLDALQEGAMVAIDEGMFERGSNLLAIAFSYRNDDALMNILRSLETRTF